MTAENASPRTSFEYSLDQEAFTFIRPEFLQLFPVDISALTPELLLEQIVDEDRDYLRDQLVHVITGKLIPSFEFRVLKQNGDRWLRLAPSLSADGRSISGIAVDITVEKESELLVGKFANKKNSVLNILSHELRGPLNIAHTLTENLDSLADDRLRSEAVAHIAQIIRSSLDLVNDFLEREFLESMNTRLSKKRVDIAARIAEYVREYSSPDKKTGRSFHFSATPGSIYLEIDEPKFMQVMNNLCTNALKFTPPGGNISVSVSETFSSVMITFTDDGIGIPQKYHSVLFDKFTPARRKGLNGEPALGLGMSVVKTIVDWHDGKIRVQSAPGKGTTFFIELPKLKTAGLA